MSEINGGILTKWQPQNGEQERGRQLKRLTDYINKIGDFTWQRKTRNIIE